MKNAKVLQWKLANILSSISFTSFSTLCFFLVVALFFNPVLAADVTDVADAFDGADPFDANVNVSYIFDYNTGSIARENFDTKSQTDSPLSNFPVNDIDVFNFTRTIHKIQLKTEIGLYKDLSFFIKVPIEAQNSFTNDFKNQNNIYVLKQNPVKYNYLGPNKEKTANILRERNLIDDDSTENTNFTDVRKGIGDMSLGFKWGAFNYQRDETKPNWTLGIEYTIPTGIKMEPYRNSGVLGGVGRGIHSFNFSSAFSKRIAFVEPYLKFDYTVNIVPNSAHGNWRTDPDCLSTNNNKPTKCGTVMENVLSHIAPGQRGTLVAGAEFIPWENLNKHQNIKIDLRFWGGFNSKGR